MSDITFRIWSKSETVFLVSLLKKNKYQEEKWHDITRPDTQFLMALKNRAYNVSKIYKRQ